MRPELAHLQLLLVLDGEGAETGAAAGHFGHAQDFVVELHLVALGAVDGEAEAVVNVGVAK